MTKKEEVLNLPTVTQEPIIEFSQIEKAGALVANEIKSYNIEEMDASDENLARLKSVRSSLNNHFKEFDARRKYIKEVVVNPYDEFKTVYDEFITVQYKNAEDVLREKIQEIESRLLNAKIEGLKNYFNENNCHDFLNFDDLGLKITRSASDKSIKTSIDEYLEKAGNDIATIRTQKHGDRILARYQITKNINTAISAVTVEIAREDVIAARKEEERRRIAENEQSARDKEEGQPVNEQKARTYGFAAPTHEQPATDDLKIYRTSFTIYATKKKIKLLKDFMQKEGIKNG